MPIVAVDVATVKAQLAILKQVAQDLGQWAEKGAPAGADRLDELVEIAKRGPVETGTFGGVVC